MRGLLRRRREYTPSICRGRTRSGGPAPSSHQTPTAAVDEASSPRKRGYRCKYRCSWCKRSAVAHSPEQNWGPRHCSVLRPSGGQVITPRHVIAGTRDRRHAARRPWKPWTCALGSDGRQRRRPHVPSRASQACCELHLGASVGRATFLEPQRASGRERWATNSADELDPPGVPLRVVRSILDVRFEPPRQEAQ
jgi:hypothetical protein